MVFVYYGEKKFEPTKYWIEELIIRRTFWFNKKEYYICSEFMKWGPFKKEEAEQHIQSLQNV